jgi:transposase-like protein
LETPDEPEPPCERVEVTMAAKKKRQSYTKEQREAVLADVPTIGVSATARKHGVPQTSVSGWLRARSREGLTAAARRKTPPTPVTPTPRVKWTPKFGPGIRVVGEACFKLERSRDHEKTLCAATHNLFSEGFTRCCGFRSNVTAAGKKSVINQNAQENGGRVVCEQCERDTVPAQQSKKGVSPPDNEAQVDHRTPRSKGGNGSSDNGGVKCRKCNIEKSDSEQHPAVHSASPGNDNAQGSTPPSDATGGGSTASGGGTGGGS